MKNIHKYIFQDIYDWAGEIRTVEIGKGNLFCTTACIQEYAAAVFKKYFSQCYSSKDNLTQFINVFAENYGDLNALHPFREGNGRTQREFARLICLKCGYDFDLSCTTHAEMLEASKLSFNLADSSHLANIFTKAITPHNELINIDSNNLKILTSDDLIIGDKDFYESYNYQEYSHSENYDKIYKEKIHQMQDSYSLDDILANSKHSLTNEHFTSEPDIER